MTIKRINPASVHQNPAYSQAVMIPPGMATLVVGGQNAVDRDGNVVGIGDIGEQTRKALENLQACLAAANATLEDLVQVRIYIREGQDLRAGFAAWMEIWGNRAEPPAVTGLFVSALARPEYLVEIEATAAIAG